MGLLAHRVFVCCFESPCQNEQKMLRRDVGQARASLLETLSRTHAPPLRDASATEFSTSPRRCAVGLRWKDRSADLCKLRAACNQYEASEPQRRPPTKHAAFMTMLDGREACAPSLLIGVAERPECDADVVPRRAEAVRLACTGLGSGSMTYSRQSPGSRPNPYQDASFACTIPAARPPSMDHTR